MPRGTAGCQIGVPGRFAFLYGPEYLYSVGMTSILDFTMKDNGGSDTPLALFRGKVLLVVNVASKCGLTPQYRSLQALYDRYRNEGLEILAFPANNFLRQEPGSESEIRRFCSNEYGVTFPLFSKISVRGRDIHPLYRFLTEPGTNPRFAGKIGWNFAKFLVDRKGAVIARFEPRVDPLAEEVTASIEAAIHSA
jgi:glutathione peroxidase